MGQVESKRQGGASGAPAIQVQSPNQQYLLAHHPGKITPTNVPTPTSPVKALLGIPAHRIRRKSVDTAFEEISKSFEAKQMCSKPDLQSTPEKEDKKDTLLTPNAQETKSKSPFLSARRKLLGGKQKTGL